MSITQTGPTSNTEPPKGRSPVRSAIYMVVVIVALLVVWFIRKPDTEDGTGRETYAMFVLEGETMGTTYRVKVASNDLGPADIDSVDKLVGERLDLVDSSMSTYKPDAELARFNASRSTEPFSFSNETITVIKAALEISGQTDGAFDITVGPLIHLWGFHDKKPLVEAPGDAGLDDARGKVGSDKLVLDLDAGTVTKLHPEVEVDLSAIAKGRAVDLIADELVARGIKNFMVEVGGEVRCGGVSQRGTPWRLGVERPDAGAREVYKVVELIDAAMATSGDYRSYYDLNGKRLSHTIDPRTGRPIDHNLASVSVIAPTCMGADAWATALNVMGPAEGYRLAQELGLKVLFITRDNKGAFTQRATSGFSAMIAAGKEVAQ